MTAVLRDLDPSQCARLQRLARALVDVRNGHVLVKPTQQTSGYWFGGGNVVRDVDGSLLLLGRYRDAGDSRTGLAAGPRGRELALFRSDDEGRSFHKVNAWAKAEIGGARQVLSIEGSALHVSSGGVQLFLSTERERSYPRSLRSFQKPGTGVWAIDRIDAASSSQLDAGRQVHRLLTGDDPAYLHVKDPNLSPGLQPDERLLLYCTHPYNWSSSASGWARLDAAGDIIDGDDDFFRRGPVWDVAASRITCRLPVPPIGAFANMPPLSLYFYDGAECLRAHDTHHHGVQRPRGYSCEELGGLAWGFDDQFPAGLQRLSRLEPLFVSPQGTGCNRYVSAMVDGDDLFAVWQQSNRRRAQPLMGKRLTARRLQRLLS